MQFDIWYKDLVPVHYIFAWNFRMWNDDLDLESKWNIILFIVIFQLFSPDSRK